MPGTFALLVNQPPDASFSSDSMILLTDGSILVHSAYQDTWMRLLPDIAGEYTTGNWSPAIKMINSRQFFASGVLKDGRVFAIGGEYSNDPNVPMGNDTPLGEIYDLSTNAWSQLSKPTTFDWIAGDAASCVLADGRVILGALLDSRTALFDQSNMSWTEAGLAHGTKPQTKVGRTNEETWTLLPDGSVLTVEVFNPDAAEKYLPGPDIWVSAGSTPQPLPLVSVAGVPVSEIGPAVLLPSGKVFAIGATGHTAIYTPTSDLTQPGSWTSGPDFKDDNGNLLSAIDAPACLLPSGKVLCVAGNTVKETDPTGAPSYWSNPTIFFEYDPDSNQLTQLPSQPSTNTLDTWTARLMLLPNGQVLFTSQQNNIAIYTPDASSNPGWRPTITSCPSQLTRGGTFSLSGRQLNGLSQAVSYGDDYSAATNYPLVRLQAGAVVKYCTTFNFSTLGVATGNTIASTDFTVPADAVVGACQLVVVVNGIASAPVNVTCT